MGESELKLALQRNGEAQIREFWNAAESAILKQRTEINAKVDRMREESNRLVQSEAAALGNNLLFEAQTKVMECRLHAEAALEKRLLVLARTLLPEIAETSRTSLWLSLREELPVAEWATITVHTADHVLAAKAFPKADIIDDEQLGGGLVATTKDKSVHVDNSLLCRLTRLWPDLLPELLAELRQQVGDDEFTRINRTG